MKTFAILFLIVASFPSNVYGQGTAADYGANHGAALFIHQSTAGRSPA